MADIEVGVKAPPTPPLNPLLHLFDPSSSNFSDDEGEEDQLATRTKSSDLVPAQRESIINQRAVIRYYADATKEPCLLESSAVAQTTEEADGSVIDVSLHLDVTNGCGGKIWPAAQVLGAYLLSKREELAARWKGKTVVELGSGTGLVGFVLAKMRIGAETWITDQE